MGSASGAGKWTTDGVSRLPSPSAMTSGMPESTVATSELVVPKSMPTILSTYKCCHECQSPRAQFSVFISDTARHLGRVARLDRQGTNDQFEFERALLQRGVKRIAGVDEAGRGPLAGPGVAAAVTFPAGWISRGLPAALAGLNGS